MNTSKLLFIISSLFKGSRPLQQEKALKYQQWIKLVEEPLFQNLPKNIFVSSGTPLLSIIMFSDNKKNLEESIVSIINQTHPSWELIIVSSNDVNQSTIIEDTRVRYLSIQRNLNTFDAFNQGLQTAQGRMVTFVNQGDQLSEHTVKFVIDEIENNIVIEVIVIDEDLIDSSGERRDPFFKPDWNPDYLLNYNYFSKAVFFSRKLLLDLRGFDCSGNDPYASYHELSLRAMKKLSNKQIAHISKVLFHFKERSLDKTCGSKIIIPSAEPLVTIIIPTKDQLELLKTCLKGVLEKTNYKNIEIIIIDNQSEESDTVAYLNELKFNSNIRVLEYNKCFNYSDMNNLAVAQAKGKLICFLNNDISMLDEGWLSEMVFHACRKEIGCVGAKLLYPDGTIQHGGVILGLEGYASHAHKSFSGDSAGYFNRLIVTHNVSAVTAACMVVRKDVFEEVGGFDAGNLKVAYNDVDLCLKVREAGYRNLFTPHAKLIHHESKSRGKKRKRKQQKQLRKESQYLLKKWGDVLFSDPAYNKNLTLLREDFSLGLDRLKN